ncbi:MAG: TraR/DksA C4-type zinc finger protein [Syntrophales bacterium]|jgi:DnaK suppressor protein
MDIMDEAQQRDRDIQSAVDDYLRRRPFDLEAYQPERAPVIDGIAYCVDCGLDIPPERVRAKPNAVTCLDCQKIRERR